MKNNVFQFGHILNLARYSTFENFSQYTLPKISDKNARVVNIPIQVWPAAKMIVAHIIEGSTRCRPKIHPFTLVFEFYNKQRLDPFTLHPFA